MKIASLFHIHQHLAKREELKGVTADEQARECYAYARKQGYCVHRDGRLYISHSRGTPHGKRWLNGHLVPR